ncbi:MAG: dihydroorotate dehydrogenase [Planctomycetota bacterium]|jgi:dihydroorotate dehydrogenase (NAD+) catalytic subunit|nr:dihydroorotate dehydrogenase [Planctomycetota bacterium]
MNDSERLKTAVGGLALDNPVMPASGTFGSGKEYDDFYDIGRLGAVVTKSVTLNPTRGNPPPRVAETPSGMLNAIGLQNEGVDAFLRDLLPPLRAKTKRVIVNVAGKSEEEYLEAVRRLASASIAVDALEINISCPNVKEGGIMFGICPETAGSLVGKLRAVAGSLPMWVKLTPNVTDIASIARAVEDAGADALVIANTFLGMAVDIEKRRPVLANVTGGLSGPAIHPMVLRLLWQTRCAVSCPLVAAGGVKSVHEIVAYLMAGASAVQVGSMNFVEPGICSRLVDDLDFWLREHGETVQGIVGSLKV